MSKEDAYQKKIKTVLKLFLRNKLLSEKLTPDGRTTMDKSALENSWRRYKKKHFGNK